MANSAADPAYRVKAVVPHDTTIVDARALYIGGAGDVYVRCRPSPVTEPDAAVALVGVAAGTILPVSAYHVTAATTATSIVALY